MMYKIENRQNINYRGAKTEFQAFTIIDGTPFYIGLFLVSGHDASIEKCVQRVENVMNDARFYPEAYLMDN